MPDTNGSPATKQDIERVSQHVERVSQDIERAIRGTHQEIERVVETMRNIETNLLTEFQRYALGQQARMHSLESGENDIKIRLGALEARVLELESRIRPKQ